jgi:hypothetical protein
MDGFCGIGKGLPGQNILEKDKEIPLSVQKDIVLRLSYNCIKMNIL